MQLPPGTPGAVVVRFRDGRPDEVIVAGTRCHDGAPMTAESVWEAASLSKPVFAVTVLRLAAAGAVDLDAPFLTAADLDECDIDPAVAPITPAHVLTHTTGLPNWRPYQQPLRLESPIGTPGYSGEAFNLLLRHLARTAGVHGELARVMDANGMTDSSFTWQDRFDDRTVIGHFESGEALDKFRPGEPAAHGTLHTTAADYARFVERNAFGDPAIQPRPDLSAVHTLVWAISESAGGPVLWQHGDNMGFKHIVATRPYAGDGVVVFTNGDRGWDLVIAETAGFAPQLFGHMP